MRHAPAILAVACLSLLGMQLSGLHMHMDSGGFSGAPHGPHVHGGGDDGHEHAGERDVDVVDLRAAASKLLLFLIAFGSTVGVLCTPARTAIPRFMPVVRSGRRARWRPPLRAPPALSASSTR